MEYTIIVMFAYQGHHIVHNLGPVFRVFVPLILYFVIMWFAAFALVWRCAVRAGKAVQGENGGEGGKTRRRTEWSYEMAVVQSFTAASNNFVSILQLSDVDHVCADDFDLTRSLLSQ